MQKNSGAHPRLAQCGYLADAFGGAGYQYVPLANRLQGSLQHFGVDGNDDGRQRHHDGTGGRRQDESNRKGKPGRQRNRHGVVAGGPPEILDRQ